MADDPTDNNQMKIMRSLKKLADLLYNKINIWFSDGEIDKATHQFPI